MSLFKTAYKDLVEAYTREYLDARHKNPEWAARCLVRLHNLVVHQWQCCDQNGDCGEPILPEPFAWLMEVLANWKAIQ